MYMKSLRERFFKKFKKTKGCWVWKGAVSNHRYGAIIDEPGPNRMMLGAHRVSWSIHNGSIPKGIFVCHKCDNPPCVRPSHLFLGTNSDNMTDKIKKARHTFGSNCKNAILNEKKVFKIRSSFIPYKVTAKQLAKKYNVLVGTINGVLEGRTWKHVKFKKIIHDYSNLMTSFSSERKRNGHGQFL